MEEPRIIMGQCEFCGIPAFKCQHFEGRVREDGSKIPESELKTKVIDEINDVPKIQTNDTEPKKKRVLFGCIEFESLTGMPMYLTYLIKGLIEKGYDVDVVAGGIGGTPTEMVRSMGGRVFNFIDEEYQHEQYDWMILQEQKSTILYDIFPEVPTINLVHSIHECETPHTPRPQIRYYLACRQDVVDHWQPKIGGRWAVLDNPIDFDRFQPVKKKANGKHTIVSCSTIDPLREGMLLNLIERAKKDPKVEVIIVGKNHGALDKVKKIPKNVSIHYETADVEEWIAKADEVAGLYCGRITLEAMAMGKITTVYQLDGSYTIEKPPKDFKQIHDYRNVAQKLVDVMEHKFADIIIPHHDRHGMLARCLNSIPLKNYNIIIVAGDTFAKNVNRAVKASDSKTLILLNDDTEVSYRTLWKVLDDPRDIVGSCQENGYCGIGLNENVEFRLLTSTEDVLFPSGAFMRLSRKAFDELGGFDERYKNGLEDVDLCIRAKKKGFTMGIIDDKIIHHESQSEGRFDNLTENIEIFNKDYKKAQLLKLFK